MHKLILNSPKWNIKIFFKLISIITLLFAVFNLLNIPVIGQDSVSNQPQEQNFVANVYFKAIVTELVGEETVEGRSYKQAIKAVAIDGPEKNKVFDLSYDKFGRIRDEQKIRVGDTVVVIKTQSGNSFEYYVADRYRLDSLAWILVIFVLVILAVSRWRGLFSTVGLVFSVIIIFSLIIPALISGQDPVFVGLWGSTLIALVSMYLAHGLGRRTNVAVLATFITLTLAVLMSIIFVNWSYLFGLGSEEAGFLEVYRGGLINLKGLLLCGMLIGTLGILDDITVSQVSIVEELHDVDSNLSMLELFSRGLNIGREHIASLINTLALAYTGASFPLLLSFTISQGQPFWVILNSEPIMEEIVRTVVGSITLILAVPISTALAAYFCKNPIKFKNPKVEEFYKKLEPKKTHHHHHHHH